MINSSLFPEPKTSVFSRLDDRKNRRARTRPIGRRHPFAIERSEIVLISLERRKRSRLVAAVTLCDSSGNEMRGKFRFIGGKACVL